MDIILQVVHQSLIRIDNAELFSGSRNYLFVKVNSFTDEWTGITKTVLFKKDLNVIPVLLDDENRCKVPNEIIQPGTFYISVIGGDLITTSGKIININKSGYDDANSPVTDPTPSVYLQIMSKMESMKNFTISEDSIKNAVSEYLKANPLVTKTDDDILELIKEYIGGALNGTY